MLDWGTNRQVVGILPGDPSAAGAMSLFMHEWVKHYGWPTLIVADQGVEFMGKEFSDVCCENGSMVHFIDARSPWQNSRTERAGGILKEKLTTTIADASIADHEEFSLAVASVVAAKNRLTDKSGFSPDQRVFGTQLRLPASLLSADKLDADFLRDQASDAVLRSWVIRDAAMASWIKNQDHDAATRAMRARPRNTLEKDIQPGAWVKVWRQPAVGKALGWIGPGVALSASSTDHSWWINMRGNLWKCSREQIRSCTDEENLGAELTKVLSADLLEDIKHGRCRSFVDTTSEDGPPDDDAIDPVAAAVAHGAEGREPEAADGESPTQASLRHIAELDYAPTSPSSKSASSGTREEPHREPMAVDAEVVFDDIVSQMRQDDEAEEHMLDPLSDDVQRTRVLDGTSELRTGNGYGPATRRDVQPALPYPAVRGTSFLPSTSPSTLFSHRLDAEQPRFIAPFSFERESFATYAEAEKSLREIGPRIFHEQSIKYVQTKAQTHPEPIPVSEERFSKDDACMIYMNDKSMWIVKKPKTSPGQIRFNQLVGEDREAFVKARGKEIQSLTDNHAVTVLSVEDSLAFEANDPDAVIDSLIVDRWKPTEEGVIAKSRWCAIGWQDPDILEIMRSAPTPTTTALYGILQVIASRRWRGRTKDAKTAFLQSRKTNRSRRLACRQPRDGGFPGLDPRQLLLLETEVYGLVSGPSWWRTTILGILVDKYGYKINPYDRCVLTLPPVVKQSGEASVFNEGVIVLEVDDMLEAGDERHQHIMKEIGNDLKFGKAEELMLPDGVLFAGRRIKQLKDFSFQIDMSSYVKERLAPVTMEKRPKPTTEALQSGIREVVELSTKKPTWCFRCTLPDKHNDRKLEWTQVITRSTYDADTDECLEENLEVQGLEIDALHLPLDKPRRLRMRYLVEWEPDALIPVTPGEEKQLRGALAGLNWCSREARPDAAAAASIYSGCFPDATVLDIKKCNKAISVVKSFEVVIRIFSIPIGDRVVILLNDSAFDTSGRDRSQYGWILGCVHKRCVKNLESDFSMVAWKSRKLPRKAPSSMLCEALSLSKGSAELLWFSTFLLSVEYSDYDMRLKDRQATLTRAEKFVLRRDNPVEYDPDGLIVIDAKALYDSLASDQTMQEDRRAALEVAVIRDDLEVTNARVRWFPHNVNPADALTKAEGANTVPLLELLRTGKIRLVDEAAQLEIHSQLKDAHGYLPRSKS